MKKRLWLALSLFVIGALVLAACQPAATTEAPTPTQAQTSAAPQPTTPPKPTEAPPTSTPSKATVVVITFPQEPDNLNPLYTNMWFSTITHAFWLRGLWSIDDQGNAVPEIAAEIPTEANGGIADGGKTITIKLNPNAQWSDGTPITADDFVFTYQMTISPKNAVASAYPYKEQVESVEAKDEHTLVVKFKEPFAPWITTLFASTVATGALPPLPKHILEPVFEKDGTLDNAQWNHAPTVGVGPFVFKEWESGGHILLVRNDKWFGPAPKVDQIFIRIVPDDASQIAAIKAGDADIGTFLSFADAPAVESTGVAKAAFDLGGFQEGWFLNMDPKTAHPAMQDVRVRKAIALATDRFKITQDLLYGKTEPPATFWDSTSPFGDPSLKAYPYDPEQAKALLDEAGWKDTNGDGTRDKDGVELKLRYITTDRQLRKDVQAVVAQMWSKVGIGADLVNYSSDVFFNTFGSNGPLYTGESDIAEYSDGPAFPDPDVAYWLCSEIPSAENPEGTNGQHYCSNDLDALFAQQVTTADLEARKAIFAKIQKIMYDEVVYIGMWRDPDVWSINKRLTGVRFSGASPFWNVTDWTVSP